MNESEFKKVIIVKARRAGYSHIMTYNYLRNILFSKKVEKRVKTINKLLNINE